MNKIICSVVSESGKQTGAKLRTFTCSLSGFYVLNANNELNMPFSFLQDIYFFTKLVFVLFVPGPQAVQPPRARADPERGRQCHDSTC